MHHKVNIQKLTINDLNDFFSLRLESLNESPASFLSSYDEERLSGFDFFKKILEDNNPKNVIFGAFIQDKLVGILGLYQEIKNKISHKSIIWGMYVQPRYRCQNIGRKLMEAAIFYAKEKIQCSIIHLSVITTNAAANKLYTALGFQIWGTEPQAICLNQQYFDEFHMCLIL